LTALYIDKTKLIDRLKQGRSNNIDETNPLRYMYQTGRNILIDVLLVEIACGDLDAEEKRPPP
jgi:hypothetical protein